MEVSRSSVDIRAIERVRKMFAHPGGNCGVRGGARDREEQVQGQRAFRSKLEAALMTRRTERSGVGLHL